MKATLGYKLSSESYYSYGYNFYSVVSLKRKLDGQSAKYCPTGWSMNIGLIGSWYEITGSYTPFFWSPSYDFIATIANTSTFYETFIYADKDNTKGIYLGAVGNPSYPPLPLINLKPIPGC